MALLIAAGFAAILFGPALLRACGPPTNPPQKTAQEIAYESKRDAELTRAAEHVVLLKQAMKDPQSFELQNAVVLGDGAACFEYRSTNSYGAFMQGRAVLTAEGKLLTQEKDRNRFVKVWNAACSQPGGTNIAPLLRQRGIG